MTGPTVEVCFFPALLAKSRKPGLKIVVVDILRATTAMCTAFGNGVESILPVVEIADARKLKQAGWLVAGEDNGIKLEFADFGNSPMEFRKSPLKGKNLAYCTTNGTKTLVTATDFGQVIAASFVNLEAVSHWLNQQHNDVLILCSGWKGHFSLEDAIFAGALADLLVNGFGFLPENDEVLAAMMLWNQASKSMMRNVSRSAHFLRLLGIEDRKGLRYCFFPEKFSVVPVMTEGRLRDFRNITG